MRKVARVAVLASLVACLVAAGAPGSAAPRFKGTIASIGPGLARRMTGVSWHPGCPVALDRLRLLTMTFWGFDGRPHTGRLVVNQDVAKSVTMAFRHLYNSRFPIRRMRLVDDYGGSDFRSIDADNTSAFNCRAATGSTHWSEHAYGHAVDVNPIENPYVSGGSTSHPASRIFLDRSRRGPGMAYVGGVLVEAFRSIGWGWGGSWSGAVHDYQHFSANGR
jgi:hypothetical protein